MRVLGLIVLTFAFTMLKAQNTVADKFGKGINIVAEDKSFSMKFSTRMQNRYVGNYNLGDTETTYSDQIYLRRARIKFDGFIYSPKVKYKMEFDVVNGYVLDAAVKWNFAKGFTLWGGQTKLPGNRERVISSQKLQFVDRSNLNSRFTLDRDKGIQLRHKSKLGNMVIKEIASISLGEGLNYTGSSNGHAYTGRIEVLPFGNFTSKGDYFASDLKREEKPKLALAATYDYNQKSTKERGQKGSEISLESDLASLQADLMFKYKGLSIMAEFANRAVLRGDTVIVDTAGAVAQSYYTGSAINLQAGYLFKSNWEVAVRYTAVTPEAITTNAYYNEYTFGISRYVVGHSLKVQADISYRETEGNDDMIIPRLQFEVAF
ncbi:MAG: phosphate-selective porin OprO/OprP [Thermoproteota archaeon]|jgi:phosphate-selective porin OprO/OprP